MYKKLQFYLSLLLLLVSMPTATLAALQRLQTDDTGQTGLDVPYFEGFDTEEAVSKWTQINNVPYQWVYLNFWGMDNSPCVKLAQYNAKEKRPCDDWIISPGLKLKKGMTYGLSFFFHSTVSFDADVSVYVLKAPTDTTSKEKILDVQSYQQNTYDGEITPKADGVYYIAFHDHTKWWENSTALRYASYIDNVTVTPKSNNASPAAITNLTHEPGKNGELSMTLKWTNPSKSREGEDLDFLSSVTVYKDKKDSVVLRDGITVGGEMSWTDPNPTEGKHSYTIVAGNTAGNSAGVSVNTYIGVDRPGAPQGVTAALNDKKTAIDLAWTPSVFGLYGGWYDTKDLSYRIVRKPDGKVLATNLEATSYTDTDLATYGVYSYEITARNVNGVGASATSSAIKAGKTANLPLRENWENEDTYPMWTIVDNNKDGYTLGINHYSGYESPSAVGFAYRDKTIDESLYTPPVKLEKGKTYKFTSKVKCGQFQSFCLDITYGKDSTVNAQRNTIKTLTDVSTDGAWSVIEETFTPASTTNAYIGLHLYNVSSSYLWFDDMRVEEMHENNIEATSITNTDTNPTVGTTVTTGITYTNVGSKRSGKFTVQLLDNDGKVLGEKKITRQLAAGGSGTASITWTPAAVGPMALRGKVVMDGDECATDDYTSYTKLTVQPDYMHAVTVGTGNTLSAVLPFSRYGVAFNQTVYTADAFGNKAGVIDSIAYKVRFSMSRDYKGVPFKIYMGNTTQTDMNTGWIPANKMSLVFDGKLDLMRGEYDLVIPFDKSFEYTGGNVSIMVVGEYDSDLFTADGYGLACYATEAGLGASRSGNVMDPNNPDQNDGSFYSYIPNTIFFINSKTYGSVTGKVTDSEGNAVKDITVTASNTNGLSAKTDADGTYTMPYVPTGWARLTTSGKGYVEASKGGSVTAGQQTVIDIKNVRKTSQVKVNGKVADAIDGSAIANATITITGDSIYTAKTNAAGEFTVDKMYTDKVFAYTIEAKDYKTVTSNWMFDSEEAEKEVDWGTLEMTPTPASPYSVAATDATDKAVVSWKLPVQPVSLSKSGTSSYGQFGGKLEMSIGQRFTPEELKAKGVDADYYLTHLRYIPMCAAKFTLKVWQGKKGYESEVYSEDMTVSSYGQWNDYTLKKPFKLDPTKNTVIGYSVSCSSGAYPLSFDRGPLVDGGDCLFDDSQNAWSSASAALSGEMDYNWNIEAVFSNDNNNRAVEWASSATTGTEEETPAYASESMPSVVKTLGSDQYSAQIFATATNVMPAKAAQKAPQANKMPVGYNVYRLACGEESLSADEWTKVNDKVVTGNSVEDTKWKDLENKPYRYAVRSVYSDDVMSESTFSDGVDKGRYSKLTVNVKANTGNIADAEVKLMNKYYTFTGNTDANGNVVFENVHFDRYQLQVLKPYYNRYADSLDINVKEQTLSAALNANAKSVEQLSATDLIDHVDLSWKQPSTAIEYEVTKSNKQHGGFIGKTSDDNTMIVGQRFTPADLKQYAYTQFYIDSISFRAGVPATYKLKVWCGPENKEMEIYSQDCVVTDTAHWAKARLDEPVLIDPSRSYIIGYEVKPNKGEYACSYDAGPHVDGGNLMYYYSAADRMYVWERLDYGSEIQGNWEIASHITNTPDETESKVKDIKYDVWRLKAADKADATKWTKLTTEAIQETSYTDAIWKDQADADYLYAVKGNYFGSTASEPTFSKLLEKGKVSLVTLKTATDNGTVAAGASVKLSNATDTYEGVTDAKGICQLQEVRKGAFTLTVAKAGFDTCSKTVELKNGYDTLSVVLNEIKSAPVYAKAESVDNNDAVSITWRAPGAYAPAEGWAYWDTNKVLGGIGSSTGEIAVGQLFTTEDQETKGMKELSISKIAFYVNDAKDEISDNPAWTAKIWRINTTGVEEVYSQDVDNVKLGAWNEVELATPYYINGNEPLLIGYEYVGSGRVIGVDRGPAVPGKGDWGNTGSGWASFSQVASLDYNVLVHAYCADLGEPADAASMTAAPVKAAMKSETGALKVTKAAVETAPVAVAHHALKAEKADNVLGYNVYRLAQGNDVDETSWTKLNQEVITETLFKDTAWKQLAKKGDYVWAIKAVYTSGESAATFTNVVNANGTSGIDNVDADAKAVVVTPNPCDGNFDIIVANKAEVVVTSVAGATVYSSSLQPGTTHVSLRQGQGVYLVNVQVNGKQTTTKLVVK